MDENPEQGIITGVNDIGNNLSPASIDMGENISPVSCVTSVNSLPL
jgi:hypothetical protein